MAAVQSRQRGRGRGRTVPRPGHGDRGSGHIALDRRSIVGVEGELEVDLSAVLVLVGKRVPLVDLALLQDFVNPHDALPDQLWLLGVVRVACNLHVLASLLAYRPLSALLRQRGSSDGSRFFRRDGW